MKFSRVKQFLKSKKVIRTGACVLAAVIVTVLQMRRMF